MLPEAGAAGEEGQEGGQPLKMRKGVCQAGEGASLAIIGDSERAKALASDGTHSSRTSSTGSMQACAEACAQVQLEVCSFASVGLTGLLVGCGRYGNVLQVGDCGLRLRFRPSSAAAAPRLECCCSCLHIRYLAISIPRAFI